MKERELELESGSEKLGKQEKREKGYIDMPLSLSDSIEIVEFA